METENRIMDLSGYIRQITKEIEDIDKDRVIVFRGEIRFMHSPVTRTCFAGKYWILTRGLKKINLMK